MTNFGVLSIFSLKKTGIFLGYFPGQAKNDTCPKKEIILVELDNKVSFYGAFSVFFFFL